MKILVSSIVDLVSSANNRLHYFIRDLAKKNSVTVIALNDWWKHAQYKGSAKENASDILSNVEYIPLTLQKMSPISQEIFSPFFLRSLEKRINFQAFDVHLNYNSLILGFFVAKKCSKLGIQTVFDVADDLSAMIGHSPQLRGEFIRKIGKLAGDNFVRGNASRAAVVTATTKRLLEDLPIPQEKAVIIPNGVDCKDFKFKEAGRRQVRNLLNISDDTFVLGYVGALREWVLLAPVFQAIRNLKHKGIICKFVIAGKEGRFNENKALAARFGIQDLVHFVGHIPYSQVPVYISAADVCVIPFLNNRITQSALPLKMFEYMACERPIISAPIRPVADAASHLVRFANSVDDYEQQILQLSHDDFLRDKLGKKGKKLVEAQYEWKKNTAKMYKILSLVGAMKKPKKTKKNP